MSMEQQSKEGPKTPDFVFTVIPKTEDFLNSINVMVEGAKLVYLKNNVKIPIIYIPEISEGFSPVRIEQVGDTRKLRIDYNNGNGAISKIVDLDILLPKEEKTNS